MKDFISPWFVLGVAFFISALLTYLSSKVKGPDWTLPLSVIVIIVALVWSVILFNKWVVTISFNKWVVTISQEFLPLIALGLAILAVSSLASYVLAHWIRRVKKRRFLENLQLFLCGGTLLLTATIAGNAITTLGNGFGNVFLSVVIGFGVLWFATSLVVEINDKINPTQTTYGTDW